MEVAGWTLRVDWPPASIHLGRNVHKDPIAIAVLPGP
jgi:hypothetical protein